MKDRENKVTFWIKKIKHCFNIPKVEIKNENEEKRVKKMKNVKKNELVKKKKKKQKLKKKNK